MNLFPPLGRDVNTRGQHCGHSPADTPDTDCKNPATWHIMWTTDGDAGLACDQHITEARRFVFLDSHPVGPDCVMPGTHWDFDAKRCVVPGEPSVEAAAVEQPATA